MTIKTKLRVFLLVSRELWRLAGSWAMVCCSWPLVEGPQPRETPNKGRKTRENAQKTLVRAERTRARPWNQILKIWTWADIRASWAWVEPFCCFLSRAKITQSYFLWCKTLTHSRWNFLPCFSRLFFTIFLPLRSTFQLPGKRGPISSLNYWDS